MRWREGTHAGTCLYICRHKNARTCRSEYVKQAEMHTGRQAARNAYARRRPCEDGTCMYPCARCTPPHTHTYPHTPACRHAWLASSFHQVDGCSVTIPIPFGCSHLNHAPPDSIRQSVSPSVRQSVCLFLSCRSASPSVRKTDNTNNNENTPSVFIRDAWSSCLWLWSHQSRCHGVSKSIPH